MSQSARGKLDSYCKTNIRAYFFKENSSSKIPRWLLLPRDLPSLLPQQLQHQVGMYHDHIWKVVHNMSHHGFLEEKITRNKDDRPIGNTVETPVAKTSRKPPPLLSDQFYKIPTVSPSNHYI